MKNLFYKKSFYLSALLSFDEAGILIKAISNEQWKQVHIYRCRCKLQSSWK